MLDFVNLKFEVNKNLKKIDGAKSLNPNEGKIVSNKLCENVEVIDEYLSMCKEMPEEHKAIIRGWKRCVKGRFFIERHLKKGSMMISAENEKVYRISGIVSSIEEMFYYAPLPLMIEATLMPFRDIIIGGYIKRALKDTYMTAKYNGVIQKSL